MSKIGISFTTFLVLLVLPASLLAQPKLPNVAPDIRSFFPAGAQKGTTVEMTFKGRYLDTVHSLEFLHPGITADVCHADFYEFVAIVTIAGDVPSGFHDYRILSGAGSNVGAIHVSDLPATKESEPNNLPAAARKISLPFAIDGVVEANDADLFRFEAAPGEQLVFQVISSRLAAGLDSQLTILDSRGNEIAFADDDGAGRDAKLVFEAKTKGEYLVQVTNAFPFGGPFNYYRLLAGKLPSVSRVFPLAIRQGGTAEITLTGVNLDLLDRVSLDKPNLSGTIVSAQPAQATVRFSVPGGYPLGIASLRLAAKNTDSIPAIPLLVTQTPESVSQSATSRSTPQRIDSLAGISGVLAANRTAHFYELEASEGDRIDIEVHGAALGSEIDPAILLYDSSGRQVAYQDEPVPWYFTEPPMADPYLAHRFEKSGRYLLAVRDTAHSGGPGYFYHLSLRPSRPDFSLRLAKPSLTLFRGRSNPLTVRVRRSGGWDTPVEVWAELAGPSPKPPHAVAEPKNSTVTDCNAKLWELDGTDVDVQLDIPKDMPAGQIPVLIHARGTARDGRLVQHTLSAMLYSGFNGPYMGETAFSGLQAAVTDLPPLLFDVPQNFNLTIGRKDRLKVNVNRFEDSSETIPVVIEDLPSGVAVESAGLAPNSNVVEFSLDPTKDAKKGTYLVRLRAGKVRTQNIEFKIDAPPEKKP